MTLKIVVGAMLGAGAVAAFAASDDGREVILEATIEPSAGPGDLVALRDADCRFFGQLERHAPASNAGRLAQAAGADGGLWRISVTRRICRDVSAPLRLHVDLPRAPSLMGGGGIPPAPMGYQAGTRFSLRAD